MSKQSFLVNSQTFSKDMKYLAREYGYDPYNSLDALEAMLFEESDICTNYIRRDEGDGYDWFDYNG